MRQVTDVGEARDVTGKGTSIKLTTASGRVCYIADSETEQVEWLSALEGAVAKIVKQARSLSRCCFALALRLLLL